MIFNLLWEFVGQNDPIKLKNLLKIDEKTSPNLTESDQKRSQTVQGWSKMNYFNGSLGRNLYLLCVCGSETVFFTSNLVAMTQ